MYCKSHVLLVECYQVPTLSVDIVFIVSNCTLSKGLVQSIWEKHQEQWIPMGYVSAPVWSSIRTVKSISKKGFHLVIPGSSSKFMSNCANNHSLRLCSHAVAVAEINGRPEEFVKWHRKPKKSPSVPKILMKDAHPKDVVKRGFLPKEESETY